MWNHHLYNFRIIPELAWEDKCPQTRFAKAQCMMISSWVIVSMALACVSADDHVPPPNNPYENSQNISFLGKFWGARCHNEQDWGKPDDNLCSANVSHCSEEGKWMTINRITTLDWNVFYYLDFKCWPALWFIIVMVIVFIIVFSAFVICFLQWNCGCCNELCACWVKY